MNIGSRFPQILKAVWFQLRLGAHSPKLRPSEKARSGRVCPPRTTEGGKGGSHCPRHVERRPGPGARGYLLACGLCSRARWESDCNRSRGCEMTHQWLTAPPWSGTEKLVLPQESWFLLPDPSRLLVLRKCCFCVHSP